MFWGTAKLRWEVKLVPWYRLTKLPNLKKVTDADKNVCWGNRRNNSHICIYYRRRRRKSIRLNRRTSKEITFKGEDEMLIRSFHTSEDKTTLSPKPMPRIDIDTGSLQILASVSHGHCWEFVFYLYVLLCLVKYKKKYQSICVFYPL